MFPALASELHDALRRGSMPLAGYLDRLNAQRRLRPLGAEAFDIATRMSGTATSGSRHLLGHAWPARDDYIQAARQTADLLLFGSRGEPISEPISAPAGELHAVEPERCIANAAVPKDMRLKKEKFEKLKTTAFDIILQNGFSTASIDDMIQPAGISRATLYRQFESKAGFFRFLLEQEIGRLDRNALPCHGHLLTKIPCRRLRRKCCAAIWNRDQSGCIAC